MMSNVSNNKNLQFLVLTAALFLSAMIGPVTATPILHEPFDYGDGAESDTLAGKGGGSGLTGTWSVSGSEGDGAVDLSSDTDDVSLAYPASVPYEESGRRALDGSGGLATRSTSEALYNLTTPARQVLYASMLIATDSDGTPDNADWAMVQTASGSGSRFAFGINDEDLFFVAVNPAVVGGTRVTGESVTTATADDGQTYFLVAKLIVNGDGVVTTPEEYFLKVYGPGDPVGPEPAAGGWDVTGSGQTALPGDQSILRIWTGTNVTAQFDEIRFGRSWGSVVPEPSMCVLLGVGWLLCQSRRRSH